MADLKIAVELAGKDTGASSAVKGVAGALTGLPGIVGAATKSFGGFLDVGSKLGMLSIGFGGLKSAVESVVGGFISGNTEMETYETQLGTLLGSADKAKDSLATLARFGATTPFELPEVVRAEKVLLGFGLTGEKVMKLTGKNADQFRSIVGDVAAGTGVAFEDIALTFGKFSAGATGEAIARFQELGVATREQMAELGIQFSKSGELLSPLPEAMDAITRIAQKKFGGGMEKLSKTAAGQLSTLADNFNQAKNQLAAPIFAVFSNAVAQANELISTEGFQGALQRVAEILAGVVQEGLRIAAGLFTQISAAVQSALPTLLQIGERLSTFFGSLLEGRTLAETVNAAFGDLIPAELNPILDAVDAAFASVKGTIAGVIQTVQTGGLAALWQEIQTAMAEFAPTGERIGAAFLAIKDAIGALIPDPLEEMIASLFESARGATEGGSALSTLAGIVNRVSEAVEGVTGFIRDNVAAQAALVGILGGVAAAWTMYTVVTKAVAVAQGIATAAQWALNVALTANPIGLVIAGLAALVIGIKYAYDNSEDFRRIVDQTWASVKSGISILIEVARIIGNTLVSAFHTAMRIYEDFRNTVQATLTAAHNIVNNTFNAISTTIDAVHQSIYNTIQSIWNQIPVDIRADLILIYNEISRRFNEALATISEIHDDIWQAIEQAWNDVTSFIEDTLGDIFGILTSSFDQQQTKINTSTADILNIVTQAWESVTRVVGEQLGKAVAEVTEFTQEVVSFLGNMAAEVLAAATTVGANIVKGIEQGISSLWGWLMDRAGDMARGILGAMKAALGISSPSREAMEIAEEIVNGLVEGLDVHSHHAYNSMQIISDQLVALGEKMHADLKQIAKNAARDLGQYNETMARDMQQKIDQTTDDFMGRLAGLGREAARAIDKVHVQMTANLEKAAQDAANSIAELISESQRRIDELVAGDLLQKQIDARRDAFSEEQRAEADAFKEAQDRAELAYRRDKAITEAALEAEEAALAAGTDADAAAIEARRQERINDALDAYREDVAEYERRKQLRQIEDDFRRRQEEERAAFEEELHQEELQRQIARINEERDERIRGITEALAAKQAAIIADAEEERKKILDNLKTRIEDLRTEYLDKVKEAMKEAGVNITEFMDGVMRDITAMTATSIAEVHRLTDAINNIPLGRKAGAEVSLSGATGGFPGIPGNIASLIPHTQSPITNHYNLTVNGNPPVNTPQQVADTIRRMELVTR